MGVFDGWFGLNGLTGLFGGNRAKLTEPGNSGAVGGGPTASGKIVTPDTAMQLATVWACVRLLSETIGTLPLGIYTKDAKGQRQPAANHDLYGLLHESPNADQTAVEYWEAVVACLGLWGNAYAEKMMVGPRLVALNFLRPDMVQVYRDANGLRRYRSSDPRASKREFGQSEIFHVRGFGIGIDAGLSPIAYARQTLGAALAADHAAAAIFGAGLQISGFIDSGQTILKGDQREEIRKMIERFTGSASAGRFMVLEAGMKFSPLGINPDDAQLLETRAFSVEEICRWFRVPPFMVGHTEKSSSWGTGLEQQMIGFLTFSLNPYLIRIEQAVKKQLMTPGDISGGVYAEFNLDGLLRADSAGRSALYSTFAQNGILTRDEIRRKENMADMPGGDVLTVQSNLVPLEKLGENPPAPTPDGFGIPVQKKPKEPDGSGSPPAHQPAA